jgi:HAMP domain-containing protein
MLGIVKSRRRIIETLGAIALLFVLSLQLFLSIRNQTQTRDEADHIFAWFMSLKSGDYGLNPEHPPLVKIETTALQKRGAVLQLSRTSFYSAAWFE